MKIATEFGFKDSLDITPLEMLQLGFVTKKNQTSDSEQKYINEPIWYLPGHKTLWTNLVGHFLETSVLDVTSCCQVLTGVDRLIDCFSSVCSYDPGEILRS